MQWNANIKYQPKGTQTRRSAVEMISSAETIIRAVEREPMLLFSVLASTDNPYIKLIQVEKTISERLGRFWLFAVCHRTDSFEKSADVVVSAPWIDPHTKDSSKVIIDEIEKTLSQEELETISGVIALSENNPFVKGMTSGIGAEHGFHDIHNSDINGVRIDKCTLITSCRGK